MFDNSILRKYYRMHSSYINSCIEYAHYTGGVITGLHEDKERILEVMHLDTLQQQVFPDVHIHRHFLCGRRAVSHRDGHQSHRGLWQAAVGRVQYDEESFLLRRLCHAADLHRSGGGVLIPHGRVQHRRGGSVRGRLHGGVRGGHSGACAVVAPDSDVFYRGGAGGRALGHYRGLSEDALRHQ